VSLRRPSLPLLFASAALVLVPWIGLLIVSLPCDYSARHWGIAWAGFDAGLALALGLTACAALRRATWLDRAAVAAGTLLMADAWFDVVTARGTGAIALAMTEALAIELPLASLCLWVGHAFARRPISDQHGTATTNKQGVLQ
jgi:hypothetical protein